MKVLTALVAAVALVLGLGWVGLRVPPRASAPPDPGAGELGTVALPAGMPPPVARFYREIHGDEIPVIDRAIIAGRGTMRVNGLTLPVRWRFVHVTGRDYRHLIEVTWFGMPVMTIDETYVDGTARLELPVGVAEGPQVDQGANLALWAEAIWMPSVWVTDPRVRWEPVDDHTALLHVPGTEGEEVFVARFSPETGLLTLFESMRFKGEQAEERTLWLNEAVRWGELDGWLLPI